MKPLGPSIAWISQDPGFGVGTSQGCQSPFISNELQGYQSPFLSNNSTGYQSPFHSSNSEGFQSPAHPACRPESLSYSPKLNNQNFTLFEKEIPNKGVSMEIAKSPDELNPRNRPSPTGQSHGDFFHTYEKKISK